uniref:HTH OST-type domain-containing protein n=1 Tax=Angiostrongylus cantonensis TaxID=6313 RepID=A0A0K0DPL3_ANGCA
MMSNSGLDNYLVILNNVLLTKRGGATIPEILKGLEELSGMDGNVKQYGFPNLETLLKSYPDKFHFEGKKWYGKVTKENEDIVRSMATEKPRKRGPDLMAPPGFENQRPSHPKNDRYTLERKQIKPKCFGNVVLGGDVAPLCPHGFNINVVQNQLRDRSTLICRSGFSI